MFFLLTLVLYRRNIALGPPVNSGRKNNIAWWHEGGSPGAVACSVSKKQILELGGGQISKLVHCHCIGMFPCIVCFDDL